MGRVSNVTFKLPDRSATPAYPSARKPMAKIRIESDDGHGLELPTPVRVARQLSEEDLGEFASPDLVVQAIREQENATCFALLVDMLSRRDHSTQEAREKLTRYGFRHDCIDDSIRRAESSRYLDDSRFASYFIEERKRRGWGRIRIEQELKRRGIDTSTIDGYPDAFFDACDDARRAREILAKKRIPDNRPYEKLVRFLMGRGFSYTLASDVVKERIASVGDDDL